MNKTEKGQAMIIIAFAAVALFAFAALAIDGGMIFSDKRHAQNAADTSALAAALAKIRGQDYTAYALSLASSNGYDNNGTSNVVEIHSPPVSGLYAGNPEYIQVIITSHVKTTFARVFGRERVTNVVEAITRSSVDVRGQTPAYNNAVFSTAETGTGIEFFGSSYVTVTGDVCTNASITTTGGTMTADVSGALCATGGINVNGQAVYGALRPAAPRQELLPVPEPDCSGLSVQTFNPNSNPLTLQPGIYNDAIHLTALGGNNNRAVNFAPGMYCLQNGIEADSGIYNGAGVMFVINNGGLSFVGGTQVNLSAPDYLVDASNNHWRGMLVYVNSGAVRLTGREDGSDDFTGTFYAPDSHCEVGQDNAHNLTVHGNFICSTFRIGGGALITINYNDDVVYRLPPPARIELIQ